MSSSLFLQQCPACTVCLKVNSQQVRKEVKRNTVLDVNKSENNCFRCVI